jgi:PPOX class probable FMN-dependent enzyme
MEGIEITGQTDLRDLIGPAMPISATKEMPKLDAHCRRFIELSPFLCLGTMSAAGKADVSPRGDPPGFVRVLDDRTVLIPDRPGNRRVDSMMNIVEQPSVGIVFFVPGIEETLRLNGHASLLRDPALLAGMAVQGKAPKLAIRVEIHEVFFHCAKALKRSRLWDPASRIERKEFPSYGQIISDQRKPAMTVPQVEAFIDDNYRKELY